MKKHFHYTAEKSRQMFGEWPHAHREMYMSEFEMAREDALEYLDYLVAIGNTTEALKVMRRELKAHFAERPCDGKWIYLSDPYFGNVQEWRVNKERNEADFKEWLTHLQYLLNFRAEIHAAHKRKMQ